MCGEGFLNGQLTVTRGLGDFSPAAPALLLQQRGRDRLKYRASLDGEPLQLLGPLTSGATRPREAVPPPAACCAPVSPVPFCLRSRCCHSDLEKNALLLCSCMEHGMEG